MFKNKKVDCGTIVRTVLMVLTFVNQIVALIGQTTFAQSPVYQWISLILTVVISVITYWFNNDWSNLALVVRDVFDMLKDGKLTSEEVNKFIEDHKKEDSETPKEGE